jgi:UDP-glucose 4-epimerase
MKALITGGAGFIGSHVADGYLAEGLDVVIVDDLSRGTQENVPARARFHRADLRDRAAVEAIFAEEKPDLINHHAAQIDVRRAVKEPIFDAECNILSSIHLLELAVQHKVKRFIYASTGGAIYGEPDTLPADEQTPVLPITPYGISKHTVEHYLFLYKKLYNLPYVVLRYGNVYGPRQSSKGEAGVVAIFCEQMLQKVTPTIYGDGKKTRDYIQVHDVLCANIKALTHGDGGIFNIASGTATTDHEIFTTVSDALGFRGIEPNYAPKRPGEVDHIVLDVGWARSGLDWRPQVGLRQGIRDTVDWFKAHRQ